MLIKQEGDEISIQKRSIRPIQGRILRCFSICFLEEW
jgi:hypothetical protein